MPKDKLSVLSLFTGAGGLDLGLEAAGFQTTLCVEVDKDARKTLSANRPEWKLANPGDIHLTEPRELLAQAGLKPKQLTLLAGGPPCQPFSKSGFWHRGESKRLSDPRSQTLNAYLRIVEAALPKVLLLENVKGLAYSGKDEGLRLLKSEIEKINKRANVNYQLHIVPLNAMDYGVPQSRERVFIVADRDGGKFEGPSPKYGKDKALQPFLTAWDALGDLDVEDWPSELQPKGKWAELLPTIPEGQNYLWHTPRNQANGGEPLFGWRTRYWTFLLKLAKHQPSWTIQAEPGPSVGPFHWRNRLLSIKELCRLQTFPDDYAIHGDRRSAHRQIGNAVPCAIGELMGLEIQRQLLSLEVRNELLLIPKRRAGCPAPTPTIPVPDRYLHLRADHADHPGVGLGPGAIQRATIDVTT